MSENSTPKVFRMIKTVPGNVIVILHPFSNPELKKVVRLTHRNPTQNLPLDWALGIFADDESYLLYKKGIITFDKNEELVKAAYEEGAYFDDKLDFLPAERDADEKIYEILKSGRRQSILDAIEKYGVNTVKLVAIEKLDTLPQGIVTMLEGIFKVQLVIDGGND